MRLVTKGQFAVIAMMDLGLRQNDGPVTLAAISRRQQVSVTYLEQLFVKLRLSELVRSTRGPGGGYSLAHNPADITVGDIIASVDEATDGKPCGKGNDRCEGKLSMTDDLWSQANVRMAEFFNSVTLQKLINDQLARGLSVADKPSSKRAISAMPVSKLTCINAPNSVFALGKSLMN